ncbi:MAG: Rieske 2Fe-2S domain-containing protein [Deltaproteobacteria bacterium]|nr:Rieske 2Fe-2S domain-containing protein [Deltaproteobacteria bacterium]
MTSPTAWTPLFPLAELAPGARRVHRVPGGRLAVFRLDDGDVFAIDDVCPHEGYPLSEGVLRGDTVTCSWHAFRFALRDGASAAGRGGAAPGRPSAPSPCA